MGRRWHGNSEGSDISKGGRGKWYGEEVAWDGEEVA